MSDDMTWSEFLKSRKDPVGKEDPEKQKSLISSWLASGDPREMTHELYGPNIANSTMFVVLAESSTDPHFIKDGSFKYIYVNEAMERMLGRPKNEVMGLTDEQLFAPEELGSMISATCRSLRGRIVREKNVRTVQGLPRTFLDTLVPWRNDFGNIVAIYGTSVDITDQTERIRTLDIDDGETRSEVMREALSLAQDAAHINTLVLLTGESGSGKDYMAKKIHEKSDRPKGPFVGVNCAALPKDLLESELFGHEKGAFSGADRRKRGRVELADKGTLLLNEIGELPLALQAKLLSFLDTKSFVRVGGEEEIKADVRIMAATNRDLEAEVGAARFRADLYYRINVFAIPIPPLRHRMEDIPMLTQSLVDKIARRMKIEVPPTIAPSFVAALSRYDWPGNVRQLGNVIEKALILGQRRKMPQLDARCVVLPNTPDQLPETGGKGNGLQSGGDKAGTVQSVVCPEPLNSNKSIPRRPEKPSDEELWRLYRTHIEPEERTRADLAQKLGVHESTLKKWFKAAGCPAGTRGRPRKSAPPKAEEYNESSTEPSTE